VAVWLVRREGLGRHVPLLVTIRESPPFWEEFLFDSINLNKMYLSNQTFATTKLYQKHCCRRNVGHSAIFLNKFTFFVNAGNL
jgi:hypothetical protein